MNTQHTLLSRWNTRRSESCNNCDETSYYQTAIDNWYDGPELCNKCVFSLNVKPPNIYIIIENLIEFYTTISVEVYDTDACITIVSYWRSIGITIAAASLEQKLAEFRLTKI